MTIKTDIKETIKTDDLVKDDELTFAKASLFATYKSQEDLQDYFSKFNGNDYTLVQLGSNLTWNWFAHILKGYEITKKTSHTPEEVDAMSDTEDDYY